MIIKPAANFSLLAVLVASVPMVNAADVYVSDPDASVAPDVIVSFDSVLNLTLTDSTNSGLTLSGRRSELVLDSGVWTDSTLNLTNLSTRGALTGYLYQALVSDEDVASFVALGTGVTGSVSNLTLVLDLGESNLNVIGGNLELQGALVVSTVNSIASDDGAVMNGTGSLDVDSSSSGQVATQQLIELGGGQANVKFLLDLNSTLRNGASYALVSETEGPDANEADFSFSALDSTNSVLFDTSYVINSAASTVNSGGLQSIVISFSRDDDEYITKSFTDNHPSNDAALKLGTIAADGVALGDMQTVLTRLDLNDFGYGDTAENLAVQVKRLAPLANSSLVISTLDAVTLATAAVDYRTSARRGNWSGYRDLDKSVWIRALGSSTNSSGSVPVATKTAQDTAGHDGFKVNASGVVLGVDKTFERGMLGLSYGSIDSSIRQLDDRVGESAKSQQYVTSLYGQLNDRYNFLAGSYTRSNGNIEGVRRTAIDRVAQFDVPVSVNELQVKAGRRFDLSDGRSAITPYIKVVKSQYTQDQYVETGAGALSLDVSQLEVDKTSGEIGVNVSHKGRFNGIKALTVLNGAIGNDFDVSDLTIRAKYTGATDDAHSDYTSFTTPAETWAANYVKLGLDLQLETNEGFMLKMGVDGELRQGRQNYSGELSLVWVF